MAPPVIAYSSERRADTRRQLGTAHYSYGFAEAKFVDCLARNGWDPVRIDNPEIFKGEQTYEDLIGARPEQVIHIAFRSTENIRLMAGAINIAAFVWEFPVMRDRHLITDTVTEDQVHMLRLMDEIWVSCQFTMDVYARYGLDKVRIIPPPIIGRRLPVRPAFATAAEHLRAVPVMPLALGTALSREANASLVAGGIASLVDHPTVQQRLAGEAGRVFLTVCNPGDRRKNLLNVIEGFQMAAGPSERDLLIIKLVVPNRGNFRATAPMDGLQPLFNGPACVHDPRIVVLCDYLDDEEMAALYSLADIYVSATHAEGLNLPLLEAMSLGTVPAATRNTAMLDYIDEDDAFVIRERSFPSPIPDMAARVAGTIFDTPFASRFDIGRAIRAAMDVDAAVLAAKADVARATIERLFSETVIMAALAERFAALHAEEPVA